MKKCLINKIYIKSFEKQYFVQNRAPSGSKQLYCSIIYSYILYVCVKIISLSVAQIFYHLSYTVVHKQHLENCSKIHFLEFFLTSDNKI